MKRILAFLLLIALSFSIYACKEDEPTPVVLNEYTVTFQPLGGTAIDPLTVTENQTANEPQDPTKANAEFRYWYYQNDSEPFDFSTPITSNIILTAVWSEPDVTLATSRTVNFENLTTEYDVENGTLDLFFPDGGNVPYVKISEYFDLLTGFIDPEVDFTFTETADSLKIFYQYYDEDEDITYDLECIFDVEKNLITTNDPGFYWAYIYSTETNYGRNIEYLYDYELNEDIEGTNVVYNLNKYALDLVYHDDAVLAPYYLVNQLFAGSSYYNVYFNGDKLYGVYGQVSTSDPEYSKIRRSSLNNTTPPADVLLHSYNQLAFNLDYFYGLKDYKNITSFYSVLAPYRTKLLSPDYETVSETIFDLLYKVIDEPHTSYGFSGFYASTRFNPTLTSFAQLGERYTAFYQDGIYAVDDVIASKWNVPSTFSGWAADSPLRPKYWLIDDTAAVITFDSFTTSDIEETTVWSDDAYKAIFDQENILPVVSGGTRYFVYNQSDDKNDISETLIWGLDNTFVDSYKTELVNAGWTLVNEATTQTDYHAGGYYTKTINEVPYMVTVAYNNTYSTAYIGLTTTIPATYDAEWKITNDIVGLIESDSAVYLETMILEVKETYPNVTKLGIDLTFNTGGNVGALYRVLGLITDQPFATSGFNRDTYSYSTTYITTSYESYTEFDWFLLTSFATFSAANEMATMFKQNNMGIIIGEVSGGGACSITPILLPDGTFFTMSSNNINMLRLSDGTYVINEDGITPDHVIPQEDLLNNTVLAGILNGN
jgi:hypothetical protein